MHTKTLTICIFGLHQHTHHTIYTQEHQSVTFCIWRPVYSRRKPTTLQSPPLTIDIDISLSIGSLSLTQYHNQCVYTSTAAVEVTVTRWLTVSI